MSGSNVTYDLRDEPGLWKIYEPQPPYRPVCEIIAVHGLGGGPASTWTHPRNQTLWLRDCLPHIVKDDTNRTSARIWSFGYNSNTVFGTSVGRISDFTTSLLSYLVARDIDTARSKIIFIAHSLGGIVVKSALVDAGRHNSQHSWLLQATAGIIFLGTPHQGANIADKASYVTSIARYSGVVRPNHALLKSLGKNSNELFSHASHFRDVCVGIQICSFYEQLPLSGTNMIIVNSNSAFIGVHGEEFTPMNADHRSICKFESLQDMNLVLVRSSIVKMMRRVTRPSSPQPPYAPPNIPAGFGGNGGPPERRNGGDAAPPRTTNYHRPTVSDVADDLSDWGISDHDVPPRPNTTESRPSQWQPPPRPPYPPDSASAPSVPSRHQNHRGRSPDYGGSQISSYASSQSMSSQYTSPYLQPPNTAYTMSQQQLRDTNRNTSPVPPRKPVPPPVEEPTDWICDVCTTGKTNMQVRYHCTDCVDYDQCMDCHMEGYVSKSHSESHKLVSIAIKHNIGTSEICPCHDNVTPQYSPPRQQANWTEGNEDLRWLHLRNSPSHARYVVRRRSKGAYLCHLAVKFKFSEYVDMNTLKRAKEMGFGKLKISLGSPLNTSTFLNERKAEDETLLQQLFGFDPSTSWVINVPDSVKTPTDEWILTFDISSQTTYLGFESGVSPTNAILGIVLQWSEVIKFQTNDNPILLMALQEIEMNELLEYTAPPPLPPAPSPRPTTRSPQPPPAQPVAPPPSSTATDDSDSDTTSTGQVTLSELLSAASYLECNNYAITSDNLLKVIAARREIEVENTVNTLVLMAQINAIRERQRREERERMLREREMERQEEVNKTVGQLLFLSWLMSE